MEFEQKIKNNSDLILFFLHPYSKLVFEDDKVYAYKPKDQYNYGISFDFESQKLYSFSNKISTFRNQPIDEYTTMVLLKIIFLINPEYTKNILLKLNISEESLPFLIEYKSQINRYLKLESSDYLQMELINIKEDRNKRKKERRRVKVVRKGEVQELKNKMKQEVHLKKERRQQLKDDINKRHFSKDKNQRVKKENVFEFTKGFNPLAEAMGFVSKIKDSYQEPTSFDAYHEKRIDKRQESQDKIIESLVIWDIENIHFFDDFSILTRYVKKENQLKIVAYGNKFKDYLSHKIDFELTKLKKRHWVVEETKKIADDLLMDKYNKYKSSLKELIIITNDSDFNPILEDALENNIHVEILHRNGRTRSSHWYDKASIVKDIRDI